MKILQYIGPFEAGDRIELVPQMGYRYIHLGLQVPFREPIALITTKALSTDITVNGTHYRIDDKGILEFDDMRETSIEIQMDRDLPWGSIIDIAYESDV